MEVVPRKRRPYSTLEKFEMKKTLVALAAVSAVSAFAQTSVTAFGVVDVAQVTKTHTSLDGTVLSKTSGINDGYHAGNRIGFRGNEDLGGGLSANFWIENGINITNGALFSTRAGAAGQQIDGMATSGGTHSNMPTGAYTTASNRQSWVSLKDAKMGEVRLGYQYTNLYEVSSLSGYHFGSEQPGGDMAHGTMSNAYFGGTRANGITYISPTFNGLTVRAQYGSGASKEEITVAAAQSANGSAIQTLNSRRGLLLRYAQGPIDGSLAYTTYKNEVAAVSASTISTVTGVLTGGTTNIFGAVSATASAVAKTESNNLLQATGTYDLTSAAKLSYSYAKGNITDGTTATVSASTKAVQYGIQYTMGNIRPFAIAGTGKITQNSTGNLIQDAKTNQYGVRYDLSKRTILYAMTGTATDGGTAVAASTIAKRSGTAFGLYHTF